MALIKICYELRASVGQKPIKAVVKMAIKLKMNTVIPNDHEMKIVDISETVNMAI